MFENIYDPDVGFKPYPTEKLLKLVKESEYAHLIDFDIDIKTQVMLLVLGIPLSDCTCRCGNLLEYRTIKKFLKDGKERFCSKSCTSTYTAQSRVEAKHKNYGGREKYCEYVTKLQRENAFKKYGQTHQSLKSTREAVKQTLMDRYGVPHNSMLDTVKEKRLVTLECGTKVDVLNTPESKAAAATTTANRTDEYREFIGQKISKGIKKHYASYINYKLLNSLDSRMPVELVAKQANCSLMTAYRALDSAGLMDIRYTESTIKEYIESLGIECITNSRKIIKPYELDVYVPEFNLAIEYDGLYWHSSNNKGGDKKAATIHLTKTEMCEELGIHLFHIFESEWLDPIKNGIWKSMIRHKLGKSHKIYARKCEKRSITAKTAFEFCELNHLQGGCYGNDYIGLFHNDELVQVAILGKPRYNKTVDVELIRMCTLVNNVVVGGASKLLGDKSYISYANRRWASTMINVYSKLDLELTHTTQPCYYYYHPSDGCVIQHRSNFMKHKLKDKLPTFDESLTEVENCYNAGYRRIWDCGSIVYKTRKE